VCIFSIYDRACSSDVHPCCSRCYRTFPRHLST
jgi:hypothetical protein